MTITTFYQNLKNCSDDRFAVDGSSDDVDCRFSVDLPQFNSGKHGSGSIRTGTHDGNPSASYSINCYGARHRPVFCFSIGTHDKEILAGHYMRMESCDFFSLDENFDPDELIKLHISIGINHSMVEDPTLFTTIDLNAFWLWVPRLITAIVAVHLFNLSLKIIRRY
jgi:hypothetical protein